ncbi:MAG: hypothetical protein AD073_000242 [Mycoplasmataceae bacterium]|nr:MAG: hypothetical protein AD073_000242 [Mycoplasmataceae bacterium]
MDKQKAFEILNISDEYFENQDLLTKSYLETIDINNLEIKKLNSDVSNDEKISEIELAYDFLLKLKNSELDNNELKINSFKKVIIEQKNINRELNEFIKLDFYSRSLSFIIIWILFVYKSIKANKINYFQFLRFFFYFLISINYNVVGLFLSISLELIINTIYNWLKSLRN